MTSLALQSIQNKKVFVSGHKGLVGRAICNRLAGENCNIISASRQQLDLTNQEKTIRFLEQNKPDIVIIAAAKVGGIGANINAPAQFIYENLAIATNLIHASHLADVQRLVFLGSSCMYPANIKQPMSEGDLLSGKPEKTNAPYALAKLAGAEMVSSYRKQYKRDYITAIPCNLYGDFDRFDKDTSHVIPALMLKATDAAKNNTKLELWGTGAPLREFLHASDLADAILFLLENYSENTPINIGSGHEVSIKQLAHKIANLAGYDGNITFDSAHPDGVGRKVMDCSLINKMGWQPSISLDDGLKSAYKWFQENIK